MSRKPAKTNSLVLGLDIGFRTTGWVLVEIVNGAYVPFKCGVICTEKANKKTNIKVATDDFNNMCHLFRELDVIAQSHKVDGVMAELPTGGAQSASAQKAMAISSAVTACIIEHLKLPYELITPIENKVALAGNKGASKDDMQDACHRLYPSEIWMKKVPTKSGKNKGVPKYPKDFEHIADAMGACEASKHTTLFRMLSR